MLIFALNKLKWATTANCDCCLAVSAYLANVGVEFMNLLKKLSRAKQIMKNNF